MRLQELIRKSGLKQRDVAGALGMSEPTISRWATGATNVPSHMIRPLAEVLGVSAARVFDAGVSEPEERAA